MSLARSWRKHVLASSLFVWNDEDMVRIVLVILLASLLALIVSCGEGPDSVVPTTVVYRGNGAEPGSLDPALADDVHAFNVLADLYEGLVATAANGSIVPAVAESWTISDDGRTYVFTLREQARWSTGEPVIASDFVRAFRRVRDPATASSYSFLLEPISSFAAVDDRTLRISLADPTPQLPAILAMPVAFPSPPDGIKPQSFVGNGPYVLQRHAVGSSIRLQRSATYWDSESVGIEEVVYLPIVEPTTELNMYRRGELDITHAIPTDSVQRLKADMPDHVRIAPSLALYYLAFDMTEPPFTDLRLRRALSMAIDREQLTSLIGRGEQAAFGIVPEGVAGHGGARFDWQSLSQEERENGAREHYRGAGYTEERPFELKLTYDTGDIHEKVALIVSSMWRDVLGVEVSLEKMEWKYFLDTRDNRSAWQVMRFAWFGDYNHASTFTNIFRTDDPQNLARYANPEYDRLLDAGAAMNDEGKRAELLLEAEAILLDDHPIVPLYFFVSKHLVNPRITGFEHNALDRHPSKFLRIEGDEPVTD